MSTAQVAPDRRAREAFSWRFTTPLFMGSALNPINSSLLATALVPIALGIGVSTSRTTTLISSLYLASAIAQPTGGKLAEVFGPRRIFLCGISLVFVGGLVGGLASSLGVLIVSRVLIGIGTSGGYPSAMVIIRRRATAVGLKQPPGNVLGGLQIAAISTAAFGLPIGGLLVDELDWRAIFFVNLPVAAVTFMAAWFWLPADPKLERRFSFSEVTTRIDLGGIVGFGASLTALLIFIDGLPSADWLYLAIAVVSAVVMVVWELRAKIPFIDIRLLGSNLPLTATYVRYGLIALCVYTVMYGLSAWLEAGHGYSAQTVGLLLLPMSVLSALIMQPISSRNLVRIPLLAAAVSSILGSVLILLMTTSSSIWFVLATTLVFGVTIGTFGPGGQTALYKQARAEDVGVAAGLLRTFGYIGSIASSAIVSLVFHTSVSDHGLHLIAVVMIVVSAAALLLTLVDRTLRGGR